MNDVISQSHNVLMAHWPTIGLIALLTVYFVFLFFYLRMLLKDK